MKKIIIHACSKHGSDSHYYDLDPNYTVIKIGIDIGVQNFSPSPNIVVHGFIGNPVCTKFTMVSGVIRTKEDLDEGMFLVNECMRIKDECEALGGLKFWVMENPGAGMLHTRIGKPKYKYQPWQYGSPWTKNTALWGDSICQSQQLKTELIRYYAKVFTFGHAIRCRALQYFISQPFNLCLSMIGAKMIFTATLICAHCAVMDLQRHFMRLTHD